MYLGHFEDEKDRIKRLERSYIENTLQSLKEKTQILSKEIEDCIEIIKSKDTPTPKLPIYKFDTDLIKRK